MPKRGDFYWLGRDQAQNKVCEWLRATYILQPGATIQRELVYKEYLCFCLETGIESTNQSAFGRLLNSVFPKLAHRRLGPRNNNKMYYSNLTRKLPSPPTPPPEPRIEGHQLPPPVADPTAEFVAPNTQPTSSCEDVIQGQCVYTEPADCHPWVLMPALATLQLLEPDYTPTTQLAPLCQFLHEFLATGKCTQFAALSSQLQDSFEDGTDCQGMAYVRFVLAWWTRFLAVDEGDGRSKAAQVLRPVLHLEELDQELKVPILEFIASCEPPSSGDAWRILSQRSAAGLLQLIDRWRHSPSHVPHHTIGKIIFHATQALSLASEMEKTQSQELLAHEMRTACGPFLAMGLFELECRGMMDVAANAVIKAHERVPSFPHPRFFTERLKKFPGVLGRLKEELYWCEDASQPSSCLSSPVSPPTLTPTMPFLNLSAPYTPALHNPYDILQLLPVPSVLNPPVEDARHFTYPSFYPHYGASQPSSSLPSHPTFYEMTYLPGRPN